jgi:large subunit ribosomal protein L3
MTDNNRIRCGSLQFYPRVRARKRIPSVNWKPFKKEGVGPMGFLGYKVGMVSVFAKDNTPDSLTKGKRINVPGTIIECPKMKIYSVRFYKDKNVAKDIVVSNDKLLKKKVKLGKESKTLGEEEKFEDVRVVLYSEVAKSGVGKKKPDLVEVGLSGSYEDKMNWIKESVSKEISVKDIFGSGLVDIRAVTKGYGSQGPVKRFGISFKVSKAEKGQRRPGSLAPWHPARVTFRAPQMGQTGNHNRVVYNGLILDVNTVKEKDINLKQGFKHYGNIKDDYIIIQGSVQGPRKSPLFITAPLKPSKKQLKRSYEVIELR